MSLESEASKEAKRRFRTTTSQNRFERGAQWAVSRITPEQVAEVLDSDGLYERDPDGAGYVLDVSAAALAVYDLYRGENGDDEGGQGDD